ncbi:MAG: phage major capsid protein [Verrucomicrobia bacterium]|nr:phage major capsid protein [Verrucomicrobiota bacterium]MDE3098615.1 phage major capsid protein [Verrucomicrobiota bacterium]
MLTQDQEREFAEILTGLRAHEANLKALADVGKMDGGLAAIKQLPDLLKRNDELHREVGRLRKQMAEGPSKQGVRWIGGVPFVTDDCAKAITSVFILDASRLKDGQALESIIPDRNRRERILNYSAECLGMNLKEAMGVIAKAALDPTTTPLPTVYVPQVIELVWHYGQARQYATVYPLGAGTVKLPRLKAGEDDFGYLGVGTAGMSQAVPEKRVTAELITFTANKLGGLIRIPTEIEEDTFIPLGQFLARYIARQLAKLEDKTLFLGDGTATYADIVGIGKYCSANAAYLTQLAAGNTAPTDATVANFRAMRAQINAAALVDDPAYYMHPTMEALLVTFNTIGTPLIYQPARGGQPATLDGFPVRWVGVMQPYTAGAAPAAFLAFFGALRYWFLGERGAPRIEVSREVFFATDELAMRALERIDVEAMAIDAMSALQTAAA